MWTQDFVMKFGRLLVRGLVRWLEVLGENPPLSRDHGLHAWRYLHERQEDGTRTPTPPAPARPDRAKGLASTGWVPGPVRPSRASLHPSI